MDLLYLYQCKLTRSQAAASITGPLAINRQAWPAKIKIIAKALIPVTHSRPKAVCCFVDSIFFILLTIENEIISSLNAESFFLPM